MRKRFFKVLAAAAVVFVVLFLGVAIWMRGQLTGSLPKLDGEIAMQDVAAPVTIERDALGIPTIRAENRMDAAYALGFVHGQDRFFQMDLLRRNSAGELAELVGPAVVKDDRKVRVHRFRDVASRVVSEGSAEDRSLLEAYTKGVNSGLASLSVKPFEYLLLGLQPAAWQPEDSVLVMFSMYLDLQGDYFANETRLGLMNELLAPAMFEFVAPLGTKWDAPIDGEAVDTPPIPGPEVFDTRDPKQVSRDLLAPPGQLASAETFHPGSNNWAVSGKHTADGRALLANDMHLDITVPHIWYRAAIVWPGADGKSQTMSGVTLPGTPAIVVGSNGHIAWGFTNSEGDWADVVVVETDPADKYSYLTPDGPRKFEHIKEIIKVQGAADETLDITSTIWGPILDHDRQGRPRALRWVAHDPAGVNMGLMRLESCDNLEEALQLANLSGSPAQNFVIADDKGRIAWTILGRIPRRVGFDGRLPTSWADGTHRWDGYLNPEEYPRIIDPENGRIWTANSRVVSGEMLAKVGHGRYDLGARAQQIRDDLLAIETASEADMLKIQLDDRAVFLEHWQQLLLSTLTSDAVAEDPRRGELRAQVENWGGRAAVDSVGFRAVRKFRQNLIAQLSELLTSPCKKCDKDFTIAKMDRSEGPVWRLVSERPEHMLDPRFKSWDHLLLSTADEVIADATEKGTKLADYTWGGHNTTKIQHPLSKAVPSLARWLDMPAQPLSGDSANMPRFQEPVGGASERLGVSPGREREGYLHTPAGQSGHPLSPHYSDGHSAWVEGKATAFLPGPAIHTLVLKPAG